MCLIHKNYHRLPFFLFLLLFVFTIKPYVVLVAPLLCVNNHVWYVISLTLIQTIYVTVLNNNVFTWFFICIAGFKWVVTNLLTFFWNPEYARNVFSHYLTCIFSIEIYIGFVTVWVPWLIVVLLEVRLYTGFIKHYCHKFN